MNIETIVQDLKVLVGGATGYAEYALRREGPIGAPNTGVYRVVVMGIGQTKVVGMGRYADFAIVVMNPASAGDVNQSNLDAAIQSEELTTVLHQYAGEDAQTAEEISSEIIRESGRIVITMTARVNYKLS